MLPYMPRLGSVEYVLTIEQPSYATACLLNLVGSFGKQFLGKFRQATSLSAMDMVFRISDQYLAIFSASISLFPLKKSVCTIFT